MLVPSARPHAAAPINIDVVLVRPSGPVNVGLVARACTNLGVRRLVVVDAQCSLTDPLLAQFAHGAAPEHTAILEALSLQEATRAHRLVVGVSGKRHKQKLAPLNLGALLPEAGPVALVFGNEQHGLRNAEMAMCDMALQLPASAQQPSYNLSHAVVLAMFAVRYMPNAPSAAPDMPTVRAPRMARQYLRAAWHDVLQVHGYFERVDMARFAPKLKRFVDTLQLDTAQMRMMSGMLKHLIKAAKATPQAHQNADRLR